MCLALGVTRSGYYAWRKRRKQGCATKDEALVIKIKESYHKSRGTYGSPRITKDLWFSGLRCNRKRVARLMRKLGIAARTKKKFKATTNSRHNLEVASNVLNREFRASTPNKSWVGDITYVWTHEGWLYLATVIDLFSRKVVGWSMSDRITAELTMSSLKMAILNRRPNAGVIFHSDRGVQYACNAFKALLKQHDFIQSMSKKGDCYDNAVAESFFHTLKTEHVYFEKYTTRAEAKNKIFEYIEVFYNRIRRHSILDYRSPAEFEERTINPT